MEENKKPIKKPSLLKILLSAGLNVLLFVSCIFIIAEYYSRSKPNPEYSILEFTIIIGLIIIFLSFSLLFTLLFTILKQQKGIIHLLEHVLIKSRGSAMPPGMPLPGSVVIVDKDGNKTTKTVDSPDDIFKMLGEIIRNNGIIKTEKKPLEEMSLEELKAEKEQAVNKGDYEYAAKIRDLIQKKEDQNDK